MEHDGQLESTSSRYLSTRFAQVACFLMAVAAAAAATTAAASLAIPDRLQVSTDIVGAPIFQATNVDRPTRLYFIVVLFFPVVSVLLYVGMTSALRRAGYLSPRGLLPATVQSYIRTDIEERGRLTELMATARVLLAGAVLGLEAGIVVSGGPKRFWLAEVSVTVAYAVMIAVAAIKLRPSTISRSGGFIMAVAWWNALAAPLALLGLVGISEVSQVRVISTGAVRGYPWLPWWLALAATAIASAWTWKQIRNSPTVGTVRALERRTLIFLIMPVALFVLLSSLPGDLGPIDAFHEGESLAGARLTAAGYFPWRDLMTVHGVLKDTLLPMVGMRLFDQSRWGVSAGMTLLLNPLFFVFLYLLGAWLVEQSGALVVMFAAALLGGVLTPMGDDRFIFWPLVLLLLAAALNRQSRVLSATLGASLAAQAILVPEASYCAPACGLVVLLSDLYHRQPGAPFAISLHKTIWMTVGGAAVAVGLIGLLVWQHSLSDFLLYFAIFAPGHALTGGLPIPPQQWDPLYAFAAILPLPAILLGFWYFAARLVAGRHLETRDWVVAASAIFAVLYYTKFLARADEPHAFQSYMTTLPLILYLVYVGCRTLERWLARSRVAFGFLGLVTMQPVSIVLMLVALLAIPGSLPGRLESSQERFRQSVQREPILSALGYSSDGVDMTTYTDLKQVFRTYLRPGDWVFDFSNEPALSYYLLGLKPHTRYYHVSMAIPEAAQRDLLRQLQADKPRLVMFTNAQYGLPSWDGIPNMVRHYDVSQYILDSYEPLLETHTQVIYSAKSAHLRSGPSETLPFAEPVAPDSLWFAGGPCQWGKAPNFLAISPPPPKSALQPITLGTREVGGQATVAGWAGDLAASEPAREVVAVAGGKVVGVSLPAVQRQDIAAGLKRPQLSRSGYELTLPRDLIATDGKTVRGVQILGISSSGLASRLSGPAGSPPGDSETLKRLRLTDGRVVPVRDGAVAGAVESVVEPGRLLEIAPPAAAPWAGYRWLEIRTRAGFKPDDWVVSDLRSVNDNHAITFSTMQTSPRTLQIYVGSCAPWHGYEHVPLYLKSGSPNEIESVSVVP